MSSLLDFYGWGCRVLKLLELAKIERLAAQAIASRLLPGTEAANKRPRGGRRRAVKIDANSALGAHSDVQTIHGVLLGSSGGNLQQELIFGLKSR
jgi:hypothetical protein